MTQARLLFLAGRNKTGKLFIELSGTDGEGRVKAGEGRKVSMEPLWLAMKEQCSLLVD